MRSLRRTFFLAPVAVFAASACSSSSGQNGPIGPVFTVEGGADVATDHLPDAASSSSSSATGDGGVKDATTGSDGAHAPDAHSPSDTGTGPDGSGDASTGGDAGDGGLTVTDASDGAAPKPDAGFCAGSTGTVALLGGTSTLAFGAVEVNGAALETTMFTGQSVNATPSLVPFGAGFLGAYTGATNGVIESTPYTGGAWGPPSPIAAVMGQDAAATELGSPVLVPLGANAELVYQGTGGNHDFYHGVFSEGAWGAASDMVGGSASMDYGPSPPTAAGSGSTLFVAYDGGNNGLYVDTWTSSGGWTGAAGINGAGTSAVPPTMIALTGGAADLMLVFELKDTNVLYSVVHTPGTGVGTWSSPLLVNANAISSTQVALAPLANGGAVMIYEGASNSFPYASVYSPTATPAWTAPAAVVPNSAALSSIPTVAAGVCGVDAIASLVFPTGVELVSLASGTWGTPVVLPDTEGLTYATIATHP